MKKTAILYWAKGGSVEKAAQTLLKVIGSDKADLFDLGSFNLEQLEQYENLILGSATIGAEVWRDATDSNKWNEFFVKLAGKSFASKKIAAFGLGNQILYPDHFVDSLGYMKEEVEKLGGKLCGAWSAEGYDFNESEGIADGMFFGLALDEDQQPELSLPRIENWVVELQKTMRF